MYIIYTSVKSFDFIIKDKYKNTFEKCNNSVSDSMLDETVRHYSNNDISSASHIQEFTKTKYLIRVDDTICMKLNHACELKISEGAGHFKVEISTMWSLSRSELDSSSLWTSCYLWC